MSVAKIYSDQSRRIDWTVRKGTDATLTVNVTQSASAFDLTTYTFIAEIFKTGSTTALLSLTQGSGLTNGGASGVITLTLTDTQLSLLGDQYFWKLRTTAPTDYLWFNGQFVVNDYLWDGGSDYTVTVDLTIGNNTISLELVSASTSGSSATNLGYTASPTNGIVTSDTGTDATLTLATGVNAGLLTPADFTKLANLATTYASANASQTQTRLRSAALSLTTNTDTNVTATALTLAAGTWDITAIVGFLPTSTTSITLRGSIGISLTSATLPSNDTGSVPTDGEVRLGSGRNPAIVNGTTDPYSYAIPQYRVTFVGSTTLYLIARATFTVSTLSVYGSITAIPVK